MDTSTHEDRSLSTLISDLSRQASELVRQETELAKSEISQKINQAKTGLVTMVIGAVVLLVGVLYVLDAVVYGLAEVLPAEYSPWLAALVVGVVFGVAGYLMIKKAQQQLKPSELAPERTASSLQRDKEVIQEQVR